MPWRPVPIRLAPPIAPSATGPASGHERRKGGRTASLAARHCPDLAQSSEVTGSMTVWTRAIELAGKPPCVACCRMAASFGATYTQ